MPDLSGIEVVKRLRNQENPIDVLVLSAYDDINYVYELLQYEIAGYLLKDEAAKLLVQAIEGVAHGERGWFSPQIKHRLTQLAQQDQERLLSPREIQVLRLTAQGKTNRAIALDLKISEKTVEKHLDSIYRKLHVRSRTEAAVVALHSALL
jgi:DNA-binding NarL/FixJ family response regulator